MISKNILVTGANMGIGFEIVKQLSALNHEVILSARVEAKRKEAVEKLRKENYSVNFIRLDVTGREQQKEALGEIERKFGSLDVLINNAGIHLNNDRHLEYIREQILQCGWQHRQQSIQVNSGATGW